MNDFSEIENELRKLRPARPSPVLFERVQEALANCRAGASPARQPERLPYNWLSLGTGLAAAAAAVLLLLARINTDPTRNEGKETAQISPARETNAAKSKVQGTTRFNEFIPASATQVVYNERDEGLQFADGLNRPLRRLRYQTHQTCQWRNPTTGASIRVSYPSEEVVLIPVSGQ
jgi:hypothetical protein